MFQTWHLTSFFLKCTSNFLVKKSLLLLSLLLWRSFSLIPTPNHVSKISHINESTQIGHIIKPPHHANRSWLMIITQWRPLKTRHRNLILSLSDQIDPTGHDSPQNKFLVTLPKAQCNRPSEPGRHSLRYLSRTCHYEHIKII